MSLRSGHSEQTAIDSSYIEALQSVADITTTMSNGKNTVFSKYLAYFFIKSQPPKILYIVYHFLRFVHNFSLD